MDDMLRLVVTQSSSGTATQLEGLKPGVESLSQLADFKRGVERFLASTLEGLYAACPHHGDPELILETQWGSANCSKCKLDLGWFCPGSSRRVCEYSEDDTNQDSCIHCGEPSERK